MVDHSAFEPFNLRGFCRAMGRRAAAGVERGREEERKCVCVTDRESVKREEMECRCVRVICRPRQSLMALCRDTGAENYLIGRIATMEVCSVPLKEKTTAAKTVIIKHLTFEDKRLHLSILFSLFKTASQRICKWNKKHNGKNYPVLKHILCILNNYYIQLIRKIIHFS